MKRGFNRIRIFKQKILNLIRICWPKGGGGWGWSCKFRFFLSTIRDGYHGVRWGNTSPHPVISNPSISDLLKTVIWLQRRCKDEAFGLTLRISISFIELSHFWLLRIDFVSGFVAMSAAPSPVAYTLNWTHLHLLYISQNNPFNRAKWGECSVGQVIWK